MTDDDISNNTFGFGVGYQFPLLEKDKAIALDVGFKQYFFSDKGMPSSQLKFGLLKSYLYDYSSKINLGVGGYYNLSSDADNSQFESSYVKKSEYGFYMRLSWAFSVGRYEELIEDSIDLEKDELIERKAGDVLNNVIFLSRYDVNSSYSKHSQKITRDLYVKHAHLNAFYSCSGTEEYNQWLSLRRIEDTLSAIEEHGVKIENYEYTVSSVCVLPEEIRVEVTQGL